MEYRSAFRQSSRNDDFAARLGLGIRKESLREESRDSNKRNLHSGSSPVDLIGTFYGKVSVAANKKSSTTIHQKSLAAGGFGVVK